MRGTLLSTAGKLDVAGIIPAYAGNTKENGFRVAPWRDHPRVCGEHHSSRSMLGYIEGSSPRMRGTHLVNLQFHDRAGIIPAYAGNTKCSSRKASRIRDHPRVCGEHCHAVRPMPDLPGSSPRMRGTRRCSRRMRTIPGIIPAYAGNTRTHQMPSQGQWDHPRVCGEHDFNDLMTKNNVGSSPRMRGTHVLRVDC